ncbi:MAG: hypothetical protein EOP55_23870 [Sphingobacteriales bacterium]|nr:MAG: hypothetical protein EOP55_23870 [Sphingobacteriales bacterium]
MKSLSLILFLLANIACSETKSVYLCDSEGGKKYHFEKTCRGLSNCQHKIIETTLDKAKSQGKTRCGWEK